LSGTPDFQTPVTMTSSIHSSRYSVLRLAGDDEEMIHLFHRSLTEYFSSLSDSSVTSSASSFSSTEMLHISNQYFDAHVLLQRLRTIVPSSTTASSEVTCGDDKSKDAEEDGIILIFHSNNSANKEEISKSFNAVSRHHRMAESSQQCGDLLRLCIGISKHDHMESHNSSITTGDEEESEGEEQRYKEEEYTRRVLWCLDHGYEYVEADLTEYGRSVGHSDREKEGFARIVEAVGNTVWSTAKMHPRKVRQLKSCYGADKNSIVESTSNIDHAMTNSPVAITENNADVTVLSTTVENDDARQQQSNEVMRTTETTEITINDDHYVPSSSNANHDCVENLMNLTEDLEEVKLESLEFLIQEANRIRDSARKGNISDDVRRRQAGEMAMRLLSVLGDEHMFGDSSSDDE